MATEQPAGSHNKLQRDEGRGRTRGEGATRDRRRIRDEDENEDEDEDEAVTALRLILLRQTRHNDSLQNGRAGGDQQSQPNGKHAIAMAHR